ncbi:MAG: hypothetical protein ACJAUW_000627 [Yoonia sp.]|jgi:hypothetical protein
MIFLTLLADGLADDPKAQSQRRLHKLAQPRLMPRSNYRVCFRMGKHFMHFAMCRSGQRRRSMSRVS